MKYEKSLGGIMALKDGQLVGWILSAQDRKWTYQVVGDKQQRPLYSNQNDAKLALESES